MAVITTPKLPPKFGFTEVDVSGVRSYKQIPGMFQVANGSYTGTGVYGSSNRTRITVPFTPRLVILTLRDTSTTGVPPVVLARGGSTHAFYQVSFPSTNGNTGVSSGGNYISWASNYIEWYGDGYYYTSSMSTTTDPAYQYNKSGQVYDYVVMGW